MLARTFILALAGGAIAAGCSRSEPPPLSRPPPPKIVGAPVASAPVNPGDIDEGLKERLARQEAAARMFESKVLNPPAPKAPEPPAALKASTPPPPPAQPPVAPKPAATSAAVPAAVTQSPAPARTDPKAEPPKVAARSESPKAAPAPRTDVAAARTAPAPEAASSRLVTRVDPDFPREAIQAGVEQGNVKARMTLDAGGNVTRVDILDAQPRRVFDRAVVRALSQWRYSEGASGRMVDMEVAFRR